MRVKAEPLPSPGILWIKARFSFRGGLPPKAAAGKNLLDNVGNPGKIVIERGGRRPDPNLINPVAQAFQPVLAKANVP
jgi:hypothetical protein